MTMPILYTLWGGLYVLCAGLGFLPEAEGFWKGVLVFLSLCFFVPGFLIAHKGTEKDRRRVRTISIVSLSVTLVLILANVLSIMATKAVGNILYVLLVLFSSPMVCGQYWAISLFLWACLMLASFQKRKK